MLINLWKTETESETESETELKQFSGLPQITCPYHLVAVREIFIEWKEPAQSIVAVLSSSLVDKGPANKFQQLHFIHQSNQSLFYHSTPTQPIWYKIQCFDLESSVFEIQNLNNTKIEIKRIFVQLEITDARFQ